MEKNNLEKQLAELMDDAILSKRLKDNKQYEVYVKEIEEAIGERRNRSPVPRAINWQRYILGIAAVGVLIAVAIWLIGSPNKKPKPVRPPAQKDVAEVVNQYFSESIKRSVAMGATQVVDIESLYNDTNDPNAFDKIIEKLESKGNRRTPKETFYLAKSYAQKPQLDKVAELLKSFDFEKYESGADVQWFYALTLLKLERTIEAIPVLQAIEKNTANPPARIRASTDLLKDLPRQ